MWIYVLRDWKGDQKRTTMNTRGVVYYFCRLKGGGGQGVFPSQKKGFPKSTLERVLSYYRLESTPGIG